MPARTRTTYTQRTDGECIVVPASNKMKIACCDCGLVHRLVFAVVTHKRVWRVAFTATRDARATAQRRRKNRTTGEMVSRYRPATHTGD